METIKECIEMLAENNNQLDKIAEATGDRVTYNSIKLSNCNVIDKLNRVLNKKIDPATE